MGIRTTIGFLTGLVLSVLAIGAAEASPYYKAAYCGGSFEPCTVTRSTREPKPAELVGLTNEAFAEFFAGYYTDPNPMFSYFVKDSNVNGYVIGEVMGPNMIHTNFVFDGSIICCIKDAPFTIADINNNDLVVVHMAYDIGNSFLASVRDAEEGGFVPNIVRGVPFSYTWNFEIIDENNNLLASCVVPEYCDGGLFVQLIVIREPRTTLVFAVATLAIFTLARRRACCVGWLASSKADSAVPSRLETTDGPAIL